MHAVAPMQVAPVRPVSVPNSPHPPGPGGRPPGMWGPPVVAAADRGFPVAGARPTTHTAIYGRDISEYLGHFLSSYFPIGIAEWF